MGKLEAHTLYKLNGRRVAGVTTITGDCVTRQKLEWLMGWANKLGQEGINHRDYTDDKADIGTLAHQMIVDSLRGERTDTRDYSANQISQAENCYLKFMEWHDENPIDVIYTETPFVSAVHAFGGTPDIYCWLNKKWDRRVLLDIKTGKAIYDEYFDQVAGYAVLLEENGYRVDQARILRVGRDEGEGFEDRVVPRLRQRMDLFLLMLRLRQTRQQINRRR